MLSCAPVSKLLYSAVAPLAVSSASGSGGSDTDWSDKRSIALKLGVPNPDDLRIGRFKIDGQKLEQMLKKQSTIDGMSGAEFFFESVMKTTATHISWPRHGAENKKNPQVRIVGKIKEVQLAKERVLTRIGLKAAHVIMKMDVSYMDHPYIIGLDGNNINRIMKDTSTRINFPESNCLDLTKNSNPVLLSGALEGVERARALVRLSSPLLFCFKLPILAAGRPQPDHDTPYVNMVQTKYNVQVLFIPHPELHSSLVQVKGSEKEALQVKEATQLLIIFFYENMANQVLVEMQLDITPQHHEIVKGENNTNLLGIMEHTKTKITFPDLSDMNLKPLKKPQVTISGTIDGVYQARQQLLGNLPIALIFGFPDNQSDASEFIGLSTKYGVYISVQQNRNQTTCVIMIRGVEKFIDKIYKARQEILRLDAPIAIAAIPEIYYTPKDKEMFSVGFRAKLSSLPAGYPDSPNTSKILTAPLQNSLYRINSNNNNYNKTQQYSTGYQCTARPIDVFPPKQKYLQIHNTNYNRQQQSNQINSDLTLATHPGLPAPITMEPTALSQQKPLQILPRNSVINTSGYQDFNSSTKSLEQACQPYSNGIGGPNGGTGGAANVGAATTISRTQYSLDSTYSSETGCSRVGRRSSDGDLMGLDPSGPIGPIVLDSAESYRNLRYDMMHNRTFDCEMKRAMGFKAIVRPPISGDLYTPNSNWAGMALSRISPASTDTVDDVLSTGIVDSILANRRLQLLQQEDIHSLLTCLGLEHYIKVFLLNEVDLEKFTTLTEENLMELGISAMNERRKLQLAIHTLQAEGTSNSGMMPATKSLINSATPGAERRSSNQLKWNGYALPATKSVINSNASSLRFSGSAAPGAERRTSNQLK